MSPSTETVPWEAPEDTAGLARIEPTPELLRQAYDAIKDDKLPPEIGDPRITARLILERIEAGTLDESMQPGESLPNWNKEYGSVPVAVKGFHLNKSTVANAEGAKGVYAVVELAIVGSGDIVTVQTGGKNVLMQLVKAWEEGRYPFVCSLEATETGSGNNTFWLRVVD